MNYTLQGITPNNIGDIVFGLLLIGERFKKDARYSLSIGSGRGYLQYREWSKENGRLIGVLKNGQYNF